MSAGAYTSVPDVIDYLYGGIKALPACAAPVTVLDGWQAGQAAKQLVVVGAGHEGDVNQIRGYAVLGQGPSFRKESYQVPILIRCWGGGTVVKTFRDEAFVLFKAIEAFVIADMNLGGAISRHYPASLDEMAFSQTESKQANRGRVAEIRTAVAVQHRY